MEDELWVPAYGFEDEAEVSDQGCCRYLTGNPVNGWIDSYGYRIYEWTIAKSKRRIKAHRLVMSSFWRNSFDGLVINHLNGVRTDNQLMNLEACTQRENVRHAIDVLGMKYGTYSPVGEENNNVRLTADQVIEIRRLKGMMNQRDIAARFGVSKFAIYSIHNGRTWKHI